MTRLQTEQQRLYGSPEAAATGRVRAVVLELVKPSGWSELARVWQAVQADLDLPAPAIAVNGRDGYQLWFSFAAPVDTLQAQAFLEALCRRYLAEVPPERVRSHLGGDGSGSIRPLPTLPPVQVEPERWSAFVTPDLAPVFADDPWLDTPPGVDAQAEVLGRLQAAAPEAFARAIGQLQQEEEPRPPALPEGVERSLDTRDPRSFLLSVMRDPGVDLRLRVEAAKALLPHTPRAS